MRNRRNSFPFPRRGRFESLEPRRLLVVPLADPLITEFMAINAGFLANEFGNVDDWIEIYNPNSSPINLAGWYLTDRKNELHTWMFPAQATIPADSFLIVYASGRDGVSPVRGELHTNFKLAEADEYLALVRPDGTTVVSEYEPDYPLQSQNISYGLTTTFDDTRYFETPTPGASNTPSFKADVFSHPHGLYETPFRLSIDESKVPGPLRYTTDGSIPTTNSPQLVSSLLVDHSMAVRVKSFAPGAASTVYTQTYLFPAQVVDQPSLLPGYPSAWQSADGATTPADYGMDPQIVEDPRFAGSLSEMLLALPTFAITMPSSDLFSSTSGIYANPIQSGDTWERAASIELFRPDAELGFQTDAGIRIEGGDTRVPSNTPKHSLRIRFDADYGPSKLEQKIFPNSDVDRFDSLSLRAAWNDSWLDTDGLVRTEALLARDQWLQETHRAMGQPAVDGQLVHLYINGLYWGIYNLSERVDTDFLANRFAGKRKDFDIIDSGELAAGSIDGWNALLALAAAGLAMPESYQAIQQHLDVTNFIDFMIVNIFAGKEDLSEGDWFAYRNHTVNDPFRFLAWDSERILRRPDADQSNVVGTASPAFLYQQLRANAEFRVAFADRVQKHLFGNGALTTAATAARWTQIAERLAPAIIAEAARWGDYRLDIHQANTGPYQLYGPTDWQAESQRLLDDYFPHRTATALAQLRAADLFPALGAPTFSRVGGEVANQERIGLGAPAGQIYYTTDGSDPRVAGDGLSTTATLYDRTLAISQDTRIRARARVGSEWSALVEETFYLRVPFVITELHYHAAPAADSGFSDNDFDFIEFTNTSDKLLDLTNLHVTQGVSFSFAEGDIRELAPGERLVIVDNREAFLARYGASIARVAGEYSGELGNAVERLTVSGRFGQPIIDFTYRDDWYRITDGDGYSLVSRESPESVTSPDNRAYWRASFVGHGNPGDTDNGHNPDDVVVSEALTHQDIEEGDWAELHNTTDHPIDIGGWFISENNTDLRKYRIAPGTVLPAHGYKRFTVDENFSNPNDPGMRVPYRLDKLGETIYLTSPDAAGMLGGYRHEAVMGYGYNSTTYIRHTNSTGEIEYVSSKVPTPAAPNAPPTVAGVSAYGEFAHAPVINEVMYHPPAGGDEFIELFNPYEIEISLDRPFAPPRLVDAVFYNFPTARTMPPLSFAIVVPIEPGLFRQKYNIPAETQIFGPWSGDLLNTGERVVFAMAAESAAYVPYAMNDQVLYNSGPDWPQAASGQGASLNRLHTFEFGNDVLNWVASIPGGTPGRPNLHASHAVVRGAVFRDTNADGVQNAGEAGIAGLRVYLDGNADGAWTLGEPSVVTAATGNYEFPNVVPGTHTVRVDKPGAAVLLGPGARSVEVMSGQSITGQSFGDIGHLWQNALNRFDVDNNGSVEPLDVLIVINDINRNGSHVVSRLAAAIGPPYLDVTGDGLVAALDVLNVINEINRQTLSPQALLAFWPFINQESARDSDVSPFAENRTATPKFESIDLQTSSGASSTAGHLQPNAVDQCFDLDNTLRVTRPSIRRPNLVQLRQKNTSAD